MGTKIPAPLQPIALPLAALALAASLFLAGCAGNGAAGSAAHATVVFPNNFSISAEVAGTPDSRATGLMFRKSLCEDCGMLFVFDYSQKHSFWMKNTLIPLDLVYIGEDGTVADVIANMPPCPKGADYCPTYEPKAPGLYVLEINSGAARENGLVPGERVSMEFDK